ncbi:MAG: cysteine desulfurase [Bacteroidetes bacterium MedPE-SWsnd-G2]|nr:MAG: cysteine desulfurase [Bacteroidetes bacterium MedPE-SWsnd-G2]
MKQVYFDSAATTQLLPEVVEIMSKTLTNNYGNPSSSHGFGRSAKALMEQSRKQIAKHFNAQASEIVFTSGGTEADNLCLRSAVRDLGINTIITSKIEHHAVLHTAEQLQREYDVNVQYVNLLEHGGIDFKHLEELLSQHSKAIVTLMHINNEIGNKLDLQRAVVLSKKYNALFHSDTVQSVGHYKIDVTETPIDYFAASAHKFHGPKGVGFAFIRKNSGLKPLIFGGEQERGLRAGTESIHNIVGMNLALEKAYDHLEEDEENITDLKQYFIASLMSALPGVSFNGFSGELNQSTYTVINTCLPIAPDKAGMLQFQLDLKGIACSRGSACQSGSNQGSHVLNEVVNSENLVKPSVRFSLSKFNTKDEIDYVVSVLKEFAS